MKTIKKIDVKSIALPTRKRVAAYARVSMESDRLAHSLSAQISYYNDLIQNNPEWEFAGVYADSFISGTSVERRAEFKRMIQDCEDWLCHLNSSFFNNNFTFTAIKVHTEMPHFSFPVRFDEHLSAVRVMTPVPDDAPDWGMTGET